MNPFTLNGPKKIIIIEDDLVSSHVITLMLEQEGFSILRNLMSADSIVEDYEKSKPDLILMDIRLGGKMDGTEAATVLRKKYQVPIIFISAFNDEKTKETIKNIKNSRLVNKPYIMAEIIAEINSLVNKNPIGE